MGDRGTGELLEQAMEALQESTIMLQVAGKLLDQGNLAEARRLRDKARARRNVSVWLMAKANTSEAEAEQSLDNYENSHSLTSH